VRRWRSDNSEETEAIAIGTSKVADDASQAYERRIKKHELMIEARSELTCYHGARGPRNCR
jgi:hypothetical protein